MDVFSPNILYHGGGELEDGKPKPAPVFGIDMIQSNCIATAGVNESTPPVGCVRLWYIPSVKATDDSSRENDTPKHLIDLCDHLSAVNTTRFSPCGLFLATASDRQIVIYKAKSKDAWSTLTSPSSIERLRFQPSLNEIYDIRWSPDSSHLVAGALDNKAEILRIRTKHATTLSGHTNYVEGVAWDPYNTMVVTQSTDRTCIVHAIKNSGTRINICGRNVIKKIVSVTSGNENTAEVDENSANQAQPSSPSNRHCEVTAGETEVITTPAPTKPTAMRASADKGRNLFADSTVPSFFRRPSFTPDGELFIAPTGVYKHMGDASNALDAEVPINIGKKSFCTHIFSRRKMTVPIASLTGLEDPSISVKCNPILFKMKDYGDDDTQTPMIPGKYRMVFAVTTISSVLIYDTQHHYPIAKITGIHYMCINDACWSEDGRMLAVCSSDGYVSFARFSEGVLGEPLDPEDIPAIMKDPPISMESDNAADTAVVLDVDSNGDDDGNDGGGKIESSGVHDLENFRVNPLDSGNTQDAVPHIPLVKKKRVAPIFLDSASAQGSAEASSSSPSSSSSSSSSFSSIPVSNTDTACNDANDVVNDLGSSSVSSTKEFSEPHAPMVKKKQRIAPDTVAVGQDSTTD